MKPKFIPRGNKYNASRIDASLKLVPRNISCPQGSVPIKRATKEDLILANYVKPVGFNHPHGFSQLSTSIDPQGHHVRKIDNLIVSKETN